MQDAVARRIAGVVSNTFVEAANGSFESFVRAGLLADFVEASSTHPGNNGPVFAPSLPAGPGAGAVPANAGRQVTDLTVRVREVGGARTTVTAGGPMGGLMPEALASTHTIALDADPDTHLGRLRLMPTVEPFFGNMLEMQLRRFRDATASFYRTANVDDFGIRVYPVLVGKNARGDLRTFFVKLWLYAFTDAIRRDCMPQAVYGVVGGAAAPRVEGAAAAGVAAPAGNPVFDAGAQAGNLDALVCERSFNDTDLHFWVDGVADFPRYTLTQAGVTPRPLACSIPGGQVYWHSPGLPQAGWVWAERRDLPTYEEYVRWMVKTAQKLDAQAEMVAAFQLAVDHGLGYLVSEGTGRQCTAAQHPDAVALRRAVEAARTADNVARASAGASARATTKAALAAAEAALAAYMADPPQVYVSASMQFRACPLPMPGYQRATLSPIMAPVQADAAAHKLLRSPRRNTMRAAVRMSNAINYAFGHAMLAFAVHGRSLTSRRGTNPMVREALWGGPVGVTPRAPPAIAAMASHLMSECFGLGIVESNARYTCVGVDDVGLSPGPWHDTVWGKWTPLVVRTPAILGYAYALPSTTSLPVQGLPLESGLGGAGGYSREVAWATGRPNMLSHEQLPYLFDDQPEVCARMRSFMAYSVSAEPIAAVGPWRNSLRKESNSAYTRISVAKQIDWVADPDCPQFWREGVLMPYSHKRASAHSWVIEPLPGAAFHRGADGLPEAFVIARAPVQAADPGNAGRQAPLLARLAARAGPPSGRAAVQPPDLDAPAPEVAVSAPAPPAPAPPGGPAFIAPAEVRPAAVAGAPGAAALAGGAPPAAAPGAVAHAPAARGEAGGAAVVAAPPAGVAQVDGLGAHAGQPAAGADAEAAVGQPGLRAAALTVDEGVLAQMERCGARHPPPPPPPPAVAAGPRSAPPRRGTARRPAPRRRPPPRPGLRRRAQAERPKGGKCVPRAAGAADSRVETLRHYLDLALRTADSRCVLRTCGQQALAPGHPRTRVQDARLPRAHAPAPGVKA